MTFVVITEKWTFLEVRIVPVRQSLVCLVLTCSAVMFWRSINWPCVTPQALYFAVSSLSTAGLLGPTHHNRGNETDLACGGDCQPLSMALTGMYVSIAEFGCDLFPCAPYLVLRIAALLVAVD